MGYNAFLNVGASQHYMLYKLFNRLTHNTKEWLLINWPVMLLDWCLSKKTFKDL